jgi:hypothetical protein
MGELLLYPTRCYPSNIVIRFSAESLRCSSHRSPNIRDSRHKFLNSPLVSVSMNSLKKQIPPQSLGISVPISRHSKSMGELLLYPTRCYPSNIVIRFSAESLRCSSHRSPNVRDSRHKFLNSPLVSRFNEWIRSKSRYHRRV